MDLDTSSGIWMPTHGTTAPMWWADLDAFTQGYVEALLANLLVERDTDSKGQTLSERWAAFSDLAPETLARIIADCGAAEPSPNTVEHGRSYWKHRQRGEFASSRPLTVQLGDDGKVRFAS